MSYLAPCPPKINRRVSCRLHVKINQIYHWGEGANWERVQSQNAFSSVKEAQSRARVACLQTGLILSPGSTVTLKSRDITMLTKVCLVIAMVFSVLLYGCESWTIKKAECWRIDAFELWCWRRLLRVPWTARRSNQSILKEISSEYSLGGLLLKLKPPNTLATWCKELTHWKRSWCWERLKMGGEGDNRGWDGWMASLTQWTWVWASSGSWWWTEKPGMLQSMGSQRVVYDWVTELTDWLNWLTDWLTVTLDKLLNWVSAL